MSDAIVATVNGRSVLDLRIELRRGGKPSTLRATLPPGPMPADELDVEIRDATTSRQLRQFRLVRDETLGDGRVVIHAADQRQDWQRPVHADINVPRGDGTAWREGEPVAGQQAVARLFEAAGLDSAGAPAIPAGTPSPVNVRARGSLGVVLEEMLAGVGLTVGVDDSGVSIVQPVADSPQVDRSRVIETVTARATVPAEISVVGGPPLELTELTDWTCVLPDDDDVLRDLADVLGEWGVNEGAARQACLSDGGFEQLLPKTGTNVAARLATLKRLAFRLFRANGDDRPWLPIGGLRQDGTFGPPVLKAKIARPRGVAPKHPAAETIEEINADVVDSFELEPEARTVYLPRPPFALAKAAAGAHDPTLQARRLTGAAQLSLTIAQPADRPPFTHAVRTGGEGSPLTVAAPHLVAVYKAGALLNAGALRRAASEFAEGFADERIDRRYLLAGVDASLACGSCARVVISADPQGLTTSVEETSLAPGVPGAPDGRRLAHGRTAGPLPSGLHQPINAFRAGPLVLRAQGETPEGEAVLAVEALHRRDDTGALELKHPGLLAFPFFLASTEAAKFGRWFFVAGVEVAGSGRLRVLGPDARHEEIPPVQLFEARHVAPQGLRGLIVSLGAEPVFIDGGPLISDARSRDPGGASSLVYDLDGSRLSKHKRGGLQFLSVLVLSPSHKQEGARDHGWAPALNLREGDTGSTETSGRGLFAEGDGHALGRLTAKLQGGPLLADSGACTKHLYGMAADDDGLYRESAGHISTDAFYKVPGDAVHDAPIKFYPLPFAGGVPSWPPFEAQLKYDSAERHPWNHKLREGRWKIQYRVPFLPEIPPTWTPPVGPPRNPVTKPPEAPVIPSPLFLPYDIQPVVSQYNLWAPSHDWVPAPSDRTNERETTFPGPSIKSEGWSAEANGEAAPASGGGVIFLPPDVAMPAAQLDSGTRQTFVTLHPQVALAFGHPAFALGRVHSGWAMQLAADGGHLELLPRDSDAATPDGLDRGVHVTGHMQVGPDGATFGASQALRLGASESEGLAFGDDIALFRDDDASLRTNANLSVGGGLAVETLSQLTSAAAGRRVLVVDDSGALSFVKLEDLHPTGTNLVSTVVSFSGSGSSGKTVSLAGINRAHCILLMRQGTGAPANVNLYLPGGATGTIAHNDLANAAAYSEDALDAPAAGTAQTLTLNTTDGSRNASGVSYRALVIGTPA